MRHVQLLSYRCLVKLNLQKKLIYLHFLTRSVIPPCSNSLDIGMVEVMSPPLNTSIKCWTNHNYGRDRSFMIKKEEKKHRIICVCWHSVAIGVWPQKEVVRLTWRADSFFPIRHTYLAQRLTMIKKVVPLEWDYFIAPRFSWPLRLSQMWITRAHHFC